MCHVPMSCSGSWRTSRIAGVLVLVGMAVAYGCADGFFAPVSTALLPDVARRDQLVAANGLIGGISSSARIVAPAIAGVVALFGAGSGFGLEAAPQLSWRRGRRNDGVVARDDPPLVRSPLDDQRQHDCRTWPGARSSPRASVRTCAPITRGIDVGPTILDIAGLPRAGRG